MSEYQKTLLLRLAIGGPIYLIIFPLIFNYKNQYLFKMMIGEEVSIPEFCLLIFLVWAITMGTELKDRF